MSNMSMFLCVVALISNTKLFWKTHNRLSPISRLLLYFRLDIFSSQKICEITGYTLRQGSTNVFNKETVVSCNNKSKHKSKGPIVAVIR